LSLDNFSDEDIRNNWSQQTDYLNLNN
jgi:hypothetical protein